jgi:2,4-dichlorophenol 6-monooxygenase
VLVRPDAHIAWRAPTLTADPAGDLRGALESILDRESNPTDNRRVLALHGEETS